jgi:hypothetical protein
MIDSICEVIKDGDTRVLTLAYGDGWDDNIFAVVTNYDGELYIESNCPEWVSIFHIYEHLAFTNRRITSEYDYETN